MTDSSADLTLSQSFEPFGAPMKAYGDASSAFGFTGEQDGVAGLVFLRARYYDPGTGRFITKDPFPGVLTLPSTLHSYQYALNNPINFVDPSGEIIPALIGALVIGAIIGGIGGGINFALNNQGMSLGDMFSSGCFWRSVGIGAAAGAIAGLVDWAVPYWLPFIGINVQAGFGAAIMGGFITGALASGAGQVTTNLLTGEKWSMGIGWALLTGGVTGGIAGGIGYKIREILYSGYIKYGELDQFGRPTGIKARITSDMIGTGTGPRPSIKPPGFGGEAAGHARGHLLGRQLGGSGDDVRNLVTLYQSPVNSPYMRGYENLIRRAVEAGETILYEVNPVYKGAIEMLIAITMRANGNKGFNLFLSILNR